MLVAPPPLNDTERLEALAASGLLDTPDEHVFDCITSLASRLYAVPICLFSLVDTKRQWFKSCVGLDAREAPREISFCSHVVFQDAPLIVPDTLEDPRFADNPVVTGDPLVRFYIGYPIHDVTGHVFGTLCLVDTRPRSFTDSELQPMRDLVYLAEHAVQTRRVGEAQAALVSKLNVARREALIDPLLRIWNRAGIDILLAEQHDLSQISGDPYAVLMVDIDRFKSVNDEHGHPVGDALLKEVVRALRSRLRSGDELGRYGGEEFIVTLPETSIDSASRLAARLCEAMRATSLPTPGGRVNRTISIGLAVLEAGESPAVLVRRADDALLAAKRAGRDRVMVSAAR